MTTGRAIVEDAEGSSHSARSMISALSLSNRTTARRTVQTLIGSYVAFNTSTRPTSRPRRWCSGCGADPNGSGVTEVAIKVSRWRAVYRGDWRDPWVARRLARAWGVTAAPGLNRPR